MSLQIIFPDEGKMKVKNLDSIKDNLIKLLTIKKVTKIEIGNLKKYLGELQGYLLVADRKNLKDYYTHFRELDFLSIFNDYLEKRIEQFIFTILEMINFLTTNIQNQELLTYIYQTKFSTHIQGIKMNIIDKLISLDTKKNEEYLTYQINFIKSLTLKINIDTLNYFYDCNINKFPILTNNSKSINKLQKEHDFIIDTVLYLSDLFSLNIEKINFILTNALLNELIFPLIYTLINKSQQIVTIYHSLYIICLILYSIKSEFLYKIITLYLFSKQISNNIFSKLPKQPFQIINKSIMDNINFLITNYLFADVNDQYWQLIKAFMKKTNGIDLSVGEIELDNIYDCLKNLMLIKNPNDYIDNIIFKAINEFFICNDDAIILILNLIIYCLLKSYKKLQNDQNDINEKEFLNKYQEDEDEDDDNNFNLINENINKKQNYNINTNLLINDFFNLDLYDEKTPNIFNYLFNYITSNKIFRLATYEIILINIHQMAQIFIEKNNKDENAKRLMQIKLVKLFDNQYYRMNELLNQDNNLNKYIFDSCIKAYDHYVKNSEKKINDLITLPNILIPIIYLDKLEDIPDYLKEDKFNNEILKNYIFNIFFINDIICDIFDNNKEKIKSNKFPFSLETIKFSIGKEYKEEQLGDDYVHCRILRNNTLAICQVILSADTLYYGEVLSGNFADLSRVKIFKKIPLRYLEIQEGDDECTLNIIDKSSKNSSNNPIKMNCLTAENTKSMQNYLLQQMIFCQNMEKSLFDSFMDDMDKRLHKYI